VSNAVLPCDESLLSLNYTKRVSCHNNNNLFVVQNHSPVLAVFALFLKPFSSLFYCVLCYMVVDVVESAFAFYFT
jgi:hypothetical protein